MVLLETEIIVGDVKSNNVFKMLESNADYFIFSPLWK